MIFLPNEILNICIARKMKPIDRLLAAETYTWRYNGAVCYKSSAVLAHELGCSPRVILASKKRLLKASIITIERTYKDNGQRSNDKLIFNEQLFKQIQSDMKNGITKNVIKGITKNVIKGITKNIPTKSCNFKTDVLHPSSTKSGKSSARPEDTQTEEKAKSNIGGHLVCPPRCEDEMDTQERSIEGPLVGPSRSDSLPPEKLDVDGVDGVEELDSLMKELGLNGQIGD